MAWILRPTRRVNSFGPDACTSELRPNRTATVAPSEPLCQSYSPQWKVTMQGGIATESLRTGIQACPIQMSNQLPALSPPQTTMPAATFVLDEKWKIVAANAAT